VADAGYISQTLANEIHVEGKRLLMARAKRNMKKLWSEMQEKMNHPAASRSLIPLRSISAGYLGASLWNLGKPTVSQTLP